MPLLRQPIYSHCQCCCHCCSYTDWHALIAASRILGVLVGQCSTTSVMEVPCRCFRTSLYLWAMVGWIITHLHEVLRSGVRLDAIPAAVAVAVRAISADTGMHRRWAAAPPPPPHPPSSMAVPMGCEEP